MEMGSSSLGVLGSSGFNDSIHGLKFGKKIYFEDVGNAGVTVPATGTDTARASVANGSKHPAPGKKVRGGGQGAQQQPPRCQVEGCKVDLTGNKTYYCRHKVCGMHSKSPKVRVNGMEQRFCQQCSRFHQLHEFDQGKRSCRRRLAGHNERRRKPPSWPISTRYGRLSSSIHENGSRFRGYLMDFTYPTLPAAATDAWTNARPQDHPAHHPCQGTLPVPPSSRVPGQVMHLHRQGSAMFANNDDRTIERLGFSDSSCALSLLSNQPWASSAAGSGSPVMISTNNYGGNPVVQSNVGASFLNNTWNFKHQEASSAILELPSEVGLALAGGSPPGSMNGHFLVEHEPGNGRFSGELELALQGSREYASSGNLVHWSLWCLPV